MLAKVPQEIIFWVVSQLFPIFPISIWTKMLYSKYWVPLQHQSLLSLLSLLRLPQRNIHFMITIRLLGFQLYHTSCAALRMTRVLKDRFCLTYRHQRHSQQRRGFVVCSLRCVVVMVHTIRYGTYCCRDAMKLETGVSNKTLPNKKTNYLSTTPPSNENTRVVLR